MSPPRSQPSQRLDSGKPACGFIAFFTWTGCHGFRRMQTIGGNVGNLEMHQFSTASGKNVYQGKRAEMPLWGPSPINLGRVRQLLAEKLHGEERKGKGKYSKSSNSEIRKKGRKDRNGSQEP